MVDNNSLQLKNTLNAPSVKKKFEDMLGKRAPQFMTSITTVVSNNSLLQKADVNSIVMGAAIAASMDLPLHPALGYAALVPFNSKDGCYAQLQVMAKGLVELFLRSGQCQSIINEVVYEGQLVRKNKFKGEYIFDESAKISDKVIGYMAYFRLTNGFEKYEYMTIEEVKAHAQKFSQAYRSGAKIWKESFDAMGLKTVLRKLISKYAPKSLEMQKAMIFDNEVVSGDINRIDEAYVVKNDDNVVDDQSPVEFKEDATRETKKEKKSEDGRVVNEVKESEPIPSPAPTNDTTNDEFPFKEDGFEF
ncbi:MAG: recombinase RecT [Alphaproteobacteria bacterium]